MRKEPQWMELRDFAVRSRGQGQIKPKTPGQAKYLEAIRSSQVTICVGPPGSGKSQLAVCQAVEDLRADKIDTIVVSRPLVECLRPGSRTESRLGFLPGGIEEKLAPFIAAVRGCLLKMMSPEELVKLEGAGVVKYQPIETMRGLTFERAFVVADEMQNASYNQIRMLLTRFADSSKVVLNGDLFQSDIVGEDEDAPLLSVMRRLNGVKGIEMIQLTDDDVVRSKLVREIEIRLR